MTLEQICDLRDKLIMDANYSQEQQTYLFGLLDREIHTQRLGLTIVVE